VRAQRPRDVRTDETARAGDEMEHERMVARDRRRLTLARSGACVTNEDAR
jgi:hypothetical protein